MARITKSTSQKEISQESEFPYLDAISGTSDSVTLFVCGDVMTGRGVDQVLPHPSEPRIHEPYVETARTYVDLAKRATGPIPEPVDFSYIWGDALEELERMAPDVRIINLETSITTNDASWTGKDIHYRMQPKNISCITAAKIDCCSLANNHILDWGYTGLTETLTTLKKANVKAVGAGENLREAEKPAVMKVMRKGRVIVFAGGSATSGIPLSWAATADKPGINLLTDFSNRTVDYIGEKILGLKKRRDIVIASIHWGVNWDYEVPPGQAKFARALIDNAGVDVIHGHSSHHVKPLEVYKDKAIIYGCGDFLNDYEGIRGHENFRSDLGLMYFVNIDSATGKLLGFQMTPTQIKHFRVSRASRADALWLRDTLNREGKKFGTRVELNEDRTLTLEWD